MARVGRRIRAVARRTGAARRGGFAAFAATCELGEHLERITEVLAPSADGRLSAAEVAIAWHADSWWALETPHLPNDALTYRDEVRAVHRSLSRGRARNGMSSDRAPTRRATGRSSCPAVRGPTETVEGLWLFAEQGGTVIVSYLSGIADETMRIVTGGYPRERCSRRSASPPRRSRCSRPASGRTVRDSSGPNGRSGSPCAARSSLD